VKTKTTQPEKSKPEYSHEETIETIAKIKKNGGRK